MSSKKHSELKPRAYNFEWEKESWAEGWLCKSRKGDSFKQAYCTVCMKDYRAHHGDLQKHAKTEAHKSNADRLAASKQKRIPSMCNVNYKTEEKVRDLKLAVHVACHSSLRSVDHLCEVLQSLKFQELKLHRTKCANLIKYVVASSLLVELVQDVGDKSYSFIIDESTDVSVSKYICICIKYFNEKFNKIITDFLGFIEISKADAISLHTSVTSFVKDVNLPISNLIGIGTDGGSNMCGKNHSLYTLLKSEIPNLQLVRCICHSLNLASSAAAEEFPASIEFLCRETYNWFSNSALRRSEYKALWETLNTINEDSDETPKTFHQFVKLSNTRWLARYNVVKVILEHYFELKTHFGMIVSGNKDKCYTARLIHQMLSDDANYLYLKIIKPILYEVNDVNLAFQRGNMNVGNAYDDLKDLIIMLARKIVKSSFMLADFDCIIKSFENDLAYLPVADADYGVEYTTALRDIKVTNVVKNDIEARAFNFIKKLCMQLATRLPENLKYFQKLKFLSSTSCLQPRRPKFSDLPFLDVFANKSDLGVMEMQYNKLLSVSWDEILSEEQLNDTYQFWAQVYLYQNAGKKFVFREFALFALTLLSLPSSNAVVERAFSIMNSVKTKFRSRMLLPLLDSITRIRMHFYAHNMCCRNFTPSSNMLTNFNTKTMYSDQSINETDKKRIELETDEILNSLEEIEYPCISLTNNI